MIKDLCQLVNADAPYWLVGMTEMTRTFGLELLESVLNDFPGVFLQVSANKCIALNLVQNSQNVVDIALFSANRISILTHMW